MVIRMQITITKTKRIMAHIADMFIASFIATLLLLIPQLSYDQEKYNEYYDQYLNGLTELIEASPEKIEEQYNIMYKMSYLTKGSLMATAFTNIAYFGIAGYLLKGQTPGKKLFGLRVVSNKEGEDLNIHLYMLREVIVANIIPTFLSVLAIYFSKPKEWMIAEIIISNLTIILPIVLITFLFLNKDEKGLQDIICKTKVIEDYIEINEV